MAIYAIGDIHGCYNALTTLFKQTPYSKEDTFVFLGDYIDRGNKSKETIDWLINFSETYNSIFLRGNHEIMMLAAIVGEDHFEGWKYSGGNSTLQSYIIKTNKDWINKIPTKHWKFIENTKSYYQTDKFIFVHAGLENGVALENQNRHSLFWEKYLIPEEYAADKTVICGHTSRKDGFIANFDHTICIDTYVYGGQWLTGLNIETGEYYQASEKKKIRTGKL